MDKDTQVVLLCLAIAVAGAWAYVCDTRERSHKALMFLGVDYASVVSRGGQLPELNEELQRSIPNKDVQLQWKLRRAGIDIEIAAPTVRYTCDLHDLRVYWRSQCRLPKVSKELRLEIETYIAALGDVSGYFYNTIIIRIG